MPLQIRRLCFILIVSLPAIVFAADRPDIVIADFEGDDYGEWKSTGEAFGKGPARGTLPNQMPVEGFEGKGLVNSFLKGDGTTGTLTSPEIRLERRYLVFLIGGGKHDTQTCLNLLVDGKAVRTATGPNGQPGGSERLEWNSWDVADLNGKAVELQIVDQATGGWGHINIDQILQSDTRRGSSLTEREIPIERDFLHFPVKNGAPKQQVKLIVNDQTVREFEIELSDTKPDFVVFADVRKFKGQKLRVQANLPYESKLLDAITAHDSIPAEQEIYTEKLRPQFHFTSRRGWLNDPNGLVYSAGEWHLFYQHNPFGWNWGNMHWGHAVSKDLFHWQELPTALYPKQWGDFAFSGSAVVDTQNAAGFKTGQDDVLLAFFTSTGRGECLAFSNDKGRTWQEYEKNPVVRHQGRDPKVVWHEDSKAWIMAVYDERPKVERGISFYTSKNLKDWEFTSRIEGFFECPDLFELTVVGAPGNKRWVLYGADGQYLLGDFDGKVFHRKTKNKQQVWYGQFYAPQTYSDAPDGRRIQIGWANGITFPGMPFNQQMTVPVELSLRTTVEGYALFAWPVKEISELADKNLASAAIKEGVVSVKPDQGVTLTDSGISLDLFDFDVEIDLKQAEKVVLMVQGTAVTYDVGQRVLSCGRVSAPLKVRDNKLQLRILGDRNSLEIFGQEGQVAFSLGGQRSETDRGIRCSAMGSEVSLSKIKVVSLKSGWLKP